ncbi:glutathione peroxidase [Terriglobus aquaticus]|uniref:Glutathione peroxidase n=1 Tax=Terriglobus aquaticus TaxID=940139 RepID=A0ABW9KNQ1_9BACT|nr:glutathione peroxidase [Terriglobus aquaticus]
MPLDIYTIPITRIDGSVGSMADFRGQVLLVVNVASQCGLTEQYEGLEHLQKRYGDRGFNVLGFPANDFGQQEPGTDQEIQKFCTGNFGVSFPMFSKIQVVGPEKHPLFAELIAQQPTAAGEGKHAWRQHLVEFGVEPNAEPELLWNFEKFLVSRTGQVVARFSPDTLPLAQPITVAIEAELAR